MRKFLAKLRVFVLSVFAMAVGAVMSATSSYAVDADVTAMFTALDLAGLKTNLVVILTVGISILIVFIAYALIKKGGNRVK